MLATDYPFLDVMWTMAIFFVWILWFWLLFTVFADIFRRHDLSGLGKTGWIVFAILLPFLGVFIYLITQNVGMLALGALSIVLDVAWKRSRGEPPAGAAAPIVSTAEE